MLRFTFFLVVWASMIAGSQAQQQQGELPEPQAPRLLPILNVLDGARLSGSLQFSGRCVEGYIPTFPPLLSSETSTGSTIEKLREALLNAPLIQVMQDGNRIRMIDPTVPTDILNLKISHISFGDGLYNPDNALAAVLQTPEVEAFMRALGGEESSHGGGLPGNLFVRWSPEYPHISGSMNNVTVSQALDRILETLPGIWVYENCPRVGKERRKIYFGFFYLEKRGSTVHVAE